jgi:hypothetical protein
MNIMELSEVILLCDNYMVDKKKLPELTYKTLTCQNVLPGLLNVY